MPDIYICRKCGRKHTKEEYNDNRFCRNCGALLFGRREDLVATRPRRDGPTHADMIADVISELSEPFTTKQILDAVIDKYSSIRSIDRNSLSTDIAGCCVNYGSHDSLPELPFLLVALRRGLYRRYDPEKDRDAQPVVEE